MNIVQITTIVTDTAKLEANGKRWIESFSTFNEKDNELILRDGIVAKKVSDTTTIEFGGGPTVKDGFSYEFTPLGNDTKMIYLGSERDYGFGDIRQLVADCEVSSLCIVTPVTISTKIWPK